MNRRKFRQSGTADRRSLRPFGARCWRRRVRARPAHQPGAVGGALATTRGAARTISMGRSRRQPLPGPRYARLPCRSRWWNATPLGKPVTNRAMSLRARPSRHRPDDGGAPGPPARPFSAAAPRPGVNIARNTLARRGSTPLQRPPALFRRHRPHRRTAQNHRGTLVHPALLLVRA